MRAAPLLLGDQLLATLMVAVLVSGCVPVNNAANWRPSDSQVHAKYYQCLREAQQGYSTSSASVGVTPEAGAGSASSSAGEKTNYHMLKSCMEAQGYQKRDATTNEVIVGVTFSPIWVPLCVVVVFVGVNCWENLGNG